MFHLAEKLYCQDCGKPFKPTSNRQPRCLKCQDKRYKERNWKQKAPKRS